MKDSIGNKAVLDTVDCILAIGQLSDRAEKLVRTIGWSPVEARTFALSEFAPLNALLSKTFPSPVFVQVFIIALLLKAAEEVSPETLERLQKVFPSEANKCQDILLYFGSRIMHKELEPEVDLEIQNSLADYLT